MPTEVIMPKVDMDMASGKITTWHVGEGEAVEKGDPLFDIETDKAAMEVESPGSGILHHRAAEGRDIPIGMPVAWLYDKGESVSAPPESGAHPEDPARTDAIPEPVAGDVFLHKDEPPVAPSADDKVRATPRARRLARDHGIALEDVTGSGPRGRIQAANVEAFADGRAPLREPSVAAAPASFHSQPGDLKVSRRGTGSGIPAVLIHGFASDSQSWAALEPHLGNRPLIRIDLPGHGKSPRRAPASFTALASELRQAFDQLGLERAHLLGHSLGGALALAIADTRPRKIASLTLLSPAGLGPEINGEAIAGICRANRAESLGPWLKRLVGDPDLITDRYIRTAMKGRADPDLRAAQTAMSDVLFPGGTQAFDLTPALGRLAMPSRIIWGKTDTIIPWRHALRAKGQTALHLYEGLGHTPQLEAPEELGKLIGGSL